MKKLIRSRGAAMVEAAVVIPVMVSFLAVIGLMKNGYDRKLQLNHQVRSQVLDYASHNCKSQTIQYDGTGQSTSQGVNTGATSSSNGTAQGGLNQVGSPSTSGIMNKTEVNYSESTVASVRRGIKGRAGLTLRINGAKSVVVCNEEPQDGDFGGILSYASGQIGTLTRR
jgi:hypothetical protein